MTRDDKGIAALLILFHHMSQHINVPPFAIIMRYIGFIMVAVFFFISGYGLIIGFTDRKGYLQGFLKRRILPLMIPYWIINIICIVVSVSSGTIYTGVDYVLSVFGFDTISSCWFVASIIIMYLMFWLSFKCFKRKAKLVLACQVFTYCIICTIAGLHSSYTASIGAFILGIYWNQIEGRILNIFRRHYFTSLAISMMVFAGLFFGRLFLSTKGIEQIELHIILRNLCSISFVLVLISLTQKVYFTGRVLDFLGDISYELYLVQALTIPILTFLQGEIGIVSTIILTVLLGWSLHGISKRAKKLIYPL